MIERSQTRRDLEKSIRSLLPDQSDIDSLTPSKRSAVSVAGLGGAFSGYLWGRFRGYQVRKKKRR